MAYVGHAEITSLNHKPEYKISEIPDSLTDQEKIPFKSTTLGKCTEGLIPSQNLDFTITINPPSPSFLLDIRHKDIACAVSPGPGLTFEFDMGDGTEKIQDKNTGPYRYPMNNNFKDYTITLTVTDTINNCFETRSKTVHVVPFIPNVFSPNGDGINDVFMKDVDLQIFDRNGTILYKGLEGWDGRYKGRFVDPDTYFYLMYFTDPKNKLLTRRGFITVVK